jgi:lysophospholipid acyltransferase
MRAVDVRISQVFGEKPSFYITFAVSAVWHGFYLTYYYMFLSWALMN